MSTLIDHKPIVSESFGVYEDMATFDLKAKLVGDFPNYFIHCVRLATNVEIKAYENGYDLGYEHACDDDEDYPLIGQ